MAETLKAEGGIRNKILAMLSYLGILCFVPLVMNRDSEFVYFHSRQGLVLWMWGVLSLFLLHVPGMGKWIFGFSAILVVGLSLLGIISVALNKMWKIPVVSSIASML